MAKTPTLQKVITDFGALDIKKLVNVNNINMIIALVDKQIQSLLEQATSVCNEAWQQNYHARENAKLPKHLREDDLKIGYYICRARIIRGTLQIEWYLQKPNFNPGKGKAKQRVYSIYVKKGSGWKYPITHFKGAQPWELEVVQYCEDQLQAIRQTFNRISKIRSQIIALTKATTVFDELAINQDAENIVQIIEPTNEPVDEDDDGFND